eukprot:CAMPEP_0114492626 /NCGR_PEP_ID=MMETSP0109-20121206/3662_1 /TAXON_ID=29199 /ORGANISM="Chlorarachnion reptans, Strain CCCM449" /LENGTH=224 /DNA_ID=CAMNT_0001669495 /DNA_START=41 /DNA_END=715 /DNA_ORIENTATION=+
MPKHEESVAPLPLARNKAPASVRTLAAVLAARLQADRGNIWERRGRRRGERGGGAGSGKVSGRQRGSEVRTMGTKNNIDLALLTRKYDQSDLFRCARGDDDWGLNVMKKLIEEGGPYKLDVIDKQDGNTLLHDACWNANLPIIRYLVEETKDKLINTQNVYGRTPLHVAMEKTGGDQSDEMVRILLKNGAKSDIKDRDGRTPFDHAFVKRTSGPCSCGMPCVIS